MGRSFHIFVCGFALCSVLSVSAQQMGTAFSSFLECPVSAHTAALGGNIVSYIDTDPMFAFSNPAALRTEADNQVYINGAVYMKNTGYTSAAYSMKFSDKDALQVGFQATMYGKMDGYDEYGNPTGKVTANDFAFLATYSRLLNKYFTIGVTLKPVINSYGGYTSFSLGSDIGIMFHDTVSLVNVGLVLQNFGGKIAGPHGIAMTNDWMPLNLAVGVSKRLAKAPLVLNLTLQNLQRWDRNECGGKVGTMIGKKFIIGVDIVPKSEKFWVSLSYNFDRGLSLKNPTVLSVSGLSFGGGGNIKMVKIGVGLAFYSSAAVTAHFTVALNINKINKKAL